MQLHSTLVKKKNGGGDKEELEDEEDELKEDEEKEDEEDSLIFCSQRLQWYNKTREFIMYEFAYIKRNLAYRKQITRRRQDRQAATITINVYVGLH